MAATYAAQLTSSYGAAALHLEQHSVAAYLSRRLGALVAIESMRPTFPGLSRETWIIDADVAGEKQGFALRLDYPWGGSCPFSLKHEWQIYSHLWKSTVPVAEPLWFDQGLEFANGRAHMVRRLVEGTTSIPGLADASAEGSRLRQRIAFECAEKLALLHTLDWQAAGLGSFMSPPHNPGGALGEELRYWRTLWDQGCTKSYPAIEEALCWLEESIPTDTPRISLCKGNNGIGEEIWRGEKIVAMSDWELGCLNDGVLDLAFSQGTLTLGDFAATLRHYERCVGHDVSPQRLAAGMFITWFKQIVLVTVYMAKRYYDGSDKRITNLTFGNIIGQDIQRRFAACIGKDIVDAWASVAGQEQNVYVRVEKSK
jgi:aminoglycoside phosphotransferase (APT) family kinase protein